MTGWRGLLAAFAFTAAAGSAGAADELPPARYDLKQQAASTGTHLTRKVVSGSAIPINRRYADLMPDEQRLVKSHYEPMLPFDEPPFPANGLQPIFEAVRGIQHNLLASGELTMFVEIDANGDAVSVSVLKSPDPKLTQALAGVLMLTKYKPAICAGAPCKMGYPFRMKFTVEH